MRHPAPARPAAHESAPPAGETYADYVDAPDGRDYVAPVIPVRVVEQAAVELRAARSWSTGRIEIQPGETRRLLDSHPARARVLLSAEDSAPMASVMTTGAAVTGPAAGADLATLPAASLPAGWYDVTVQAIYTGTTSTGVERNNVQLLKGVTPVWVIPISGFSSATPAGATLRMYLDGATALVVEVVAAATATAVYGASIIATRVPSAGTVYVSATDMMAPYGAALTPARPQEFRHREAVYAYVAPGGNPVTVAWAAEYLDG